MKIKKGDEVMVMAGKDRGRRGKVARVFPKEGLVLVAGINLYKKHKKSQGGGSGEIVEMPRPLDVAKVAVWCGSCNKPARVGYLVSSEGRKERICRKCNGILKS